MGSEHTLKAISVYYKQRFSSNAPKEYEVAVSDDGKQWLSIGVTPSYSFSFADKEKKCGINFLKPMKCRYFKLVIKSVMSSWYGANLMKSML